jgi:hypothetical protein
MVGIAVVYRKAVSTEYLLSGVYSINGKHLDTLDELDYIYNHYEELFTLISGLTRKQLDNDIARVDRELTLLNYMYSERVALRSWTIDSRIRALDDQAKTARPGRKKIRLKARAFGLKLYRNTYINRPLRGIKEEIRRKEADKNVLMTNGPELIEGHYRKLTDTYNFIHNNRLLLENARREEEIINSLSKLGNDYHVINNVNLNRNNKLPVKIARKPLLPCTIAHIVVGPTGLFLIIMMPSGDLKSEESQKCLRQAIYINRNVKKFLQMNDLSEYEVKPRTVLVTLNQGYSGEYPGESIDIVSLDRLSRYLKHRNCRITNYTVDEMVHLFNR